MVPMRLSVAPSLSIATSCSSDSLLLVRCFQIPQNKSRMATKNQEVEKLLLRSVILLKEWIVESENLLVIMYYSIIIK